MTARGDDPHRWIPVARTWLGHRPEPFVHERAWACPLVLDDSRMVEIVESSAWPGPLTESAWRADVWRLLRRWDEFRSRMLAFAARYDQLVAGPWRDDVALAAAQRIERELGPWPEPAL